MIYQDYKQTSIDEFSNITKYDIGVFFINVNGFFTSDYQNVVNWYSGKANKANSASFFKLKMLIKDAERINQLFDIYRNTFQKAYFWELMENFQEIRDRLETTSNLSKYLRSPRKKDSYTSNPEYDYVMKQHDTLEKIQRENISGDNFDNQWVDIALRNDLSEDEYDSRGGVQIKLPLNFTSISLESVVDNLEGEKLYGLDIQKKLEFFGDDLKVLSYKDTFIQAINILLSVKIGDIPETPNIGYDQGLVIGTNIASLNLPILKRQLNELMKTDDTISIFNINSIKTLDDGIMMDFSISSVYGNVYNSTIKVGI